MSTLSDDVITLADEHLFRSKGYQQQWKSVESDIIHLDDLPRYNHPNGLGLDWQTLERLNLNTAHPPDFKPVSTLKPTAPAFVPSKEVFDDTSPRIFVEPRSGQCILPAGQRSALELARQYQAKQRLATTMLPTPPSSSSPQWSQNFPNYGEDPSYVDGHSQYLDHHSSNLDNEELRNFVYNNLKVDNKPSVNFTQQQLSVSDSPVLKQSCTDEFSPPRPRPPPNSPLPAVTTSLSLDTRLRARLSAAPSSPTSPDLRPRPQLRPMPPGRQPRSIPFARLIQRRQLASVPEEEYVESKPQPSSTKAAAVPSSPFSSNPPRLPDISNSTQSRSPSPTKSAPKKKAAGSGDSSQQWRRTSGQPPARVSEDNKENGSGKASEKVKRKSNKKVIGEKTLSVSTPGASGGIGL